MKKHKIFAKAHHKPNVWRRLWLRLGLLVGLVLILSALKRMRLAPKKHEAPASP
jgi:hypothetical protein